MKEKGLNKKYELIQSGDKVKFVYLKTPNPLMEILFHSLASYQRNLDLTIY